MIDQTISHTPALRAAPGKQRWPPWRRVIDWALITTAVGAVLCCVYDTSGVCSDATPNGIAEGTCSNDDSIACDTNTDCVTVSGPKTNAYLGPLTRIIKMKLLAPFIEQRLVFFVANVGVPDLELFARMMAEGKLKSVIDRRYPLAQAGAALDYIASGHARGKVIVVPE